MLWASTRSRSWGACLYKLDLPVEDHVLGGPSGDGEPLKVGGQGLVLQHGPELVQRAYGGGLGRGVIGAAPRPGLPAGEEVGEVEGDEGGDGEGGNDEGDLGQGEPEVDEGGPAPGKDEGHAPENEAGDAGGHDDRTPT